MGMLDWIKGRGKTETPPGPSRSHSLFSEFPDRVLKTEADVKLDNALVMMTVVMDEINKDPCGNWQRCQKDFEKAVVDVREAFEAFAPAREAHNPVERTGIER